MSQAAQKRKLQSQASAARERELRHAATVKKLKKGQSFNESLQGGLAMTFGQSAKDKLENADDDPTVRDLEASPDIDDVEEPLTIDVDVMAERFE